MILRKVEKPQYIFFYFYDLEHEKWIIPRLRAR